MIKNNKQRLKYFEKFVNFHNKRKDKRHIQGDKIYSDYDSLAGMSMILFIISIFMFNVLMIITSLTIIILFVVLNNTDITPKIKQ